MLTTDLAVKQPMKLCTENNCKQDQPSIKHRPPTNVSM